MKPSEVAAEAGCAKRCPLAFPHFGVHKLLIFKTYKIVVPAKGRDKPAFKTVVILTDGATSQFPTLLNVRSRTSFSPF